MTRRYWNLVCLVALGAVINSCTPGNEKQVRDTQPIEFTLQKSLPHDTESFTQGLVIHKGELYESTGQEGSWIGIVDITTGSPEKKVVLDKKYFGEGIVILNNKVYQLTWKNETGFVYALPGFEKVLEFSYKGEGWGLTTNGEHLIMSNGTEQLYFLDSVTLKPIRTVSATNKGNAVSNLNELEYADGVIYANIWQTDLVARIDPGTGEVTGFLDLSTLARQARTVNPKADVLNGIAWHPATKTMLVTGKFWPYIFVLKLKS